MLLIVSTGPMLIITKINPSYILQESQTVKNETINPKNMNLDRVRILQRHVIIIYTCTVITKG